MRHYGDICAMHGNSIEPVDCIIGGSPCQDLSVAGKRAGLKGKRSSLFLEQIRIIKEMREEDIKRGTPVELIRPRYAIWENVPGALSSGEPKGEDFRCVLEEFARIADPAANVPRPPDGTWRTAGAIVGDGWSIAWRVMDAQFFGVAQRRRRIAVICDFADECANEILFERKGVHGDSPQGRETREATAGDSGTGIAVADQVDGEGSGVVWPNVANTLTCRHDGSPMPGQLQQICVTPYDTTQITSQANASNPTPGAPCHTLNAQAHTPLIVASGFSGHRAGDIGYSEECAPTMETHMPLNVVAGFKAGQGSKAQGIGFAEEQCPTLGAESATPAIVCRTDQTGANGLGVNLDVAHTLDGAAGQAVMCMSTGQANAEITHDICPTLNCNHEQPVCFDARGNGDGKIAPTLTGDHGNRVTDYTALAVDPLTPWDVQSERVITPDAIAPTMSGCDGKGGRNPVGLMLQHSVVRRLTTLECERLQGYPDGWTDIPEITDITDEGYELFKQLLFDAAVRDGTTKQNQATGIWEIWSKWRCKVRHGGEVLYMATVWKNTQKPYQHKTKVQMVKYINSLKSDSAIYKSLGNSIALPPWLWLCQQIHSRHSTPLTMGSLFDGIGGFPLIWEGINGQGTCRWASEIEPFCVAVTMHRFEMRGGIKWL